MQVISGAETGRGVRRLRLLEPGEIIRAMLPAKKKEL